MLRSANDLRGHAILATDGVIGTVDDLYFDDDDWAVRYLVVDTGGWLSGRKVLLSPHAIGHPDWLDRQVPVSLTKAQVAASPDIDTHKPVSRQSEADYYNYYGYAPYWNGTDLWGTGGYPAGVATNLQTGQSMVSRRAATHAPCDSHLRSCRSVVGHHVHAKDGDIGHIDDMLVDDTSWAIRYAIVNTSNWWGGHRVLVAPLWIDNVDWVEAKVTVDLTREAIQSAPPYDAAAQLDRQQELAIHEHYHRRGYWPEA